MSLKYVLLSVAVIICLLVGALISFWFLCLPTVQAVFRAMPEELARLVFTVGFVGVIAWSVLIPVLIAQWLGLDVGKPIMR